METRIYPYRPRWSVLLSSSLLFAGVGGIFGWQIVQGGGLLFWCLAGVSGLFVLLGVFVALMRILVPQRIVLQPGALVLPASRWSKEERMVRLDEIENIEYQHIAGQRILTLWYGQGKTSISASMLPTQRDFLEVAQHLGLDPHVLEDRP